jgi:uncharacterized protein
MFSGKHRQQIPSSVKFTLTLSTVVLLMVAIAGISPLSNKPLEIQPVLAAASKAQSLPISAIAKIGGQKIELEVAKTLQQQATGLMFRQTLADNRGMLFPFKPPQPVSFWMKNCLIALDMIFIHKGKVVAIAANSPPCTAYPCPSYESGAAVDQVIELRGGRAAELNLRLGDVIVVEFLPNKKTANTP